MSPRTITALRVLAVVGVVCIAAAGAYALAGRHRDADVAATGSTAWIDQPRDGSIVTDAVQTVTAHAADPDGVRSMHLTVGEVVAGEATTDGATFTTSTFEWDPPGLGEYVLSVVGIDATGASTTPGSAMIVVAEPIDPSAPATDISATSSSGSSTTSTTGQAVPPTSVTITTSGPPSATSSTVVPPSSVTVPTTPCAPAAPEPTTPADAAIVTDRTPTLSWTYEGCDGGGFTVEVKRILTARGNVSTSTLPQSERSWEPPPAQALACLYTYYWRVGAGPAAPVWSDWRSFTVHCVVP